MIRAITSTLYSIPATCTLVALLVLAGLVPLAYSQQAARPDTGASAAKVPDFSGVWRTVREAAVPVPKGSTLRWVPAPGELPSFKPEYAEKFKTVQQSRERGSEDTEPEARCLPPGMPYHMWAEYGLEIVQGRDKMALFSEWMDAYRRIYMDGRKVPKDWEPSYYGYSTGHWEGDTLVVETVGLREDTVLDRYGSPHSDDMRITERIRLVNPDSLEDKFVVNDSKAFTRPWEYTVTYRRAGAGNDELRENTCTEGWKSEK
ncbi:MAG TPA: hypothetical protein VE422_25600 [Terriglobia bacterium]|nr:hypothetical protein [Terriglobia bacterium]